MRATESRTAALRVRAVRAALLVACGVGFFPCIGAADAPTSYVLLRTEVTKHVAGGQPATSTVEGGLKALELVTNETAFMSRGNLNVALPARIAGDQEKFSVTARLECTWSLKTPTPNLNVGLNVMGVPKTIAKGDPGPWPDAGSHTLSVDVTVEATLASGFGVRKWEEGGRSYRSLSLGGHTGVGQTLSGFNLVYVYGGTNDSATPGGTVEVVSVVGEVEVSPGGDASRARALRPGDRIETWDMLVTGMDSTVKLRFADGTVVDVGELTDMKVAAFIDAGNAVQTRLWLRGGEASASVNRSSERPSSLEVKTPTATLGVRGTRFTVRHDKASGLTTVRVTEGAVELAPADPSRKPVSLTAGQSIDVSLDAVSPVRGP
jgi:hypothetical protein